jgi:hypothetical protein
MNFAASFPDSDIGGVDVETERRISLSKSKISPGSSRGCFCCRAATLGIAKQSLATSMGRRMDRRQIYHADPEIMGGTLVFTGTRVPVDSLILHYPKTHSQVMGGL